MSVPHKSVLVIYNDDDGKVMYQSDGATASDLAVAPVGKGKNLPKKPPAKVRNAAKLIPTIVHPAFHNCIPIIDDPFWIETFRKISLGTFPRHYYYADDVFRYQLKTKIKTCDLRGLSGQEFVDAVQRFMRSSSNVFSTKDVTIIREKIRHIAEMSIRKNRRIKQWHVSLPRKQKQKYWMMINAIS
jgi:hypothetical protein